MGEEPTGDRRGLVVTKWPVPGRASNRKGPVTKSAVKRTAEGPAVASPQSWPTSWTLSGSGSRVGQVQDVLDQPIDRVGVEALGGIRRAPGE